MHEVETEREGRVGAQHEAALRLVPLPLLVRLFAGALFAAGWVASVFVPLVRVVESDVPGAIFVAAVTIATIAPAVLYLRRHALDATVRWDDETITLLRGGRVATSIAWSDACLRQRRDSAMPRRARLVQIVDPGGRRITLTTGAVIGVPSPVGRVRIEPAALDAILRAASRRASFVRDAPVPETTPRALVAWLAGSIFVAIAFPGSALAVGQTCAFAFALACVALLVDPARRVLAALRRPVGRETLVIDTEERGRVRARRLDGSRVLLDVAAASHPDARLSSRRGFVSAVLAIPEGGTGTYRSMETPIPATYVETRDDRVLRFEHLRAALVDVIGYGAFFATALAAALTLA